MTPEQEGESRYQRGLTHRRRSVERARLDLAAAEEELDQFERHREANVRYYTMVARTMRAEQT